MTEIPEKEILVLLNNFFHHGHLILKMFLGGEISGGEFLETRTEPECHVDFKILNGANNV